MKNWMTRFGVLVAITAVMGSALMVGCGGSSDNSDTAPPASNAAPSAGKDTAHG